MNEQSIRQAIEQVDSEGKIPSAVVDELVSSLTQEGDKGDTTAIQETLEDRLREQLGNEQDWRKKASIAARIISINLD